MVAARRLPWRAAPRGAATGPHIVLVVGRKVSKRDFAQKDPVHQEPCSATSDKYDSGFCPPYEQDPNLRQEAIAKARPDVDLQPDDDEPVVVALLVDLVSFTWPQDRLLTMLTRSMARSTFIDQTIIFQAPKWFTRWIELQYPYAGVDIKSIHDPVMRPEVLEVASELWQPLKSTSPYQSAEVAIRAGHQLV